MIEAMSLQGIEYINLVLTQSNLSIILKNNNFQKAVEYMLNKQFMNNQMMDDSRPMMNDDQGSVFSIHDEVYNIRHI